MSVSDWDEIKRLANDFQRIQLSSSHQKLSERNCIEIVQRLIDLKLLEVIYTINGKEYLTPVELCKEILEELTLAGGRVNLADLQQTLNVNFSHIEASASELLKHDGSLKLILGQLIDRNYMAKLAEEINDRLQEQGSLTVSELAKTYNLPGDVLKELIQSKLAKGIEGRCSDDGADLYTESFVARHKAVIRGTFAAFTRPTQVFPLIGKMACQERLFYVLLDELASESQLPGSLSGGRPYNVVYTPHLYTRSQLEWVDSFYKQNSYLEYDSLTRLGFIDPEAFIKKKFKGTGMHYLSTCCLGGIFRERVVSEMEEALSVGEFFSCAPLLPSICSDTDLKAFLESIVQENHTSLSVLADHYVVGGKIIAASVDSFKDSMRRKAEKTVKENPSILVSLERAFCDERGSAGRKEDAREGRKKKNQGGGGGGHQGREVKTKNTKKKYLANQHKGADDDDEDNRDDGDDDDQEGKTGVQTFLTLAEIASHLATLPQFTGAPEELVVAVANHISRTLNSQYSEEMKGVFMRSIHNAHNNNMRRASTEDDAAGEAAAETPPQQRPSSNKKKLVAELSETLLSHWSNVKVFEKALQYFQDDALTQLSGHLLKSLCKDCLSILLCVFSIDNVANASQYKSLTDEDRLKMISLFKDDKDKGQMTKLNASLRAKTLDDFNALFENICSKSNISLKRDKKKERLMQFNHKHSLLESLKSSTDAALSLHLVSVILFNSFTQCILHSSGRSVPSIISFLHFHLLPEHHQLMLQCQEAVIKGLKAPTGDEGRQVELQELVEKVKLLPDLVKEYPKKIEKD